VHGEGRAPRVFEGPLIHLSAEDDMQIALSVLRKFRRVEEGQDLLEYALLCSLIALVAFGAVSTVGNTILTVFWNVIAAANI
jgi:Flp pilus assembly pilin Flp